MCINISHYTSLSPVSKKRVCAHTHNPTTPHLSLSLSQSLTPTPTPDNNLSASEDVRSNNKNLVHELMF